MINVTIKGDIEKLLDKRLLDMLIEKQDAWFSIYKSPFYWINPSYMFTDGSGNATDEAAVFLFGWFILFITSTTICALCDVTSIWAIGGLIFLSILSLLLMIKIKGAERRQFIEKMDKMMFMTTDQYKEYARNHPEMTERAWQEATDLIEKMKVLSDCESVLSVQLDDYSTHVKYVTDDKTVKYLKIHHNAEIVEKLDVTDPELLLDIADDGSFKLLYIRQYQSKDKTDPIT